MAAIARQADGLVPAIVLVLVCAMGLLCLLTLPDPASSTVAVEALAALVQQRYDGPVCEATLAEAPRSEPGHLFVVQTGSEVQMVQDFVRFLQQHGLEAHIYSTPFIMIIYNGEYFLIDVRVKRGELSRIIVAKVFDIAQEYRHTLELSTYVMRLNKQLDFAHFALSEKGDRLIVQGNITFVDAIDVQEIRKFLDFFSGGIVLMFDLLPETVEYLK